MSSYTNAFTSFLDYIDAAAATAAPVPTINASMRVAGTATPALIYECTITPTMAFPGNMSGHWTVDATLTLVGDSLLELASIADSMAAYFSANPNFTPTLPTNSCRIGMETISFTTGAEQPDDGQQDAERTITIAVTFQVREG